MRKITILFLMFLCVLEGKAGAPGKDPGIALIPQPVSCARGKGQFLLTPQTRVVISESDSSCKDIAGFLADRLHLSALYRTEVQLEGRKTSVIRLQLNKKRDSILGKEGYLLEVKPSGVRIRANGPQGWFYGIQTFLQLLPASIEAGKAVPYQTWSVPAVTIKDYPRFAYRGLMLDVSRHFFPKDMLLAYINQMAKYKFNSFHLHLTDDQGWRIAIRGLPRLTEVGAWRVPRTGYWDNSIEPPVAGEQATCGGYYTVEDIQEIVHYAARRCITVIPEIDVPAHCLALIASYPQLSCSGLPVLVNPGTPWNDQQENVLCAGNDSVYLVLDQILSQVAGLFPGKYIHIGGDEAVKTFWNRCPKCRKRMQQEHLGSAADLQSYFIKRIARIVESKGKKVIGWDEILEGGLAKEATVMSWRGMEGGMQAASMGHQVIMAPWQHAYLDLFQGDPLMENGPGAVCRLSSCYNFEPVPAGVNAALVLGVQGNLWTEQVPNERQAQYMTWPRAMALSEVCWSQNNQREWKGFVFRMEQHFFRLDAAGVKYSRVAYEPQVTAHKAVNGAITLMIDTEVEGLDVFYSFDDTAPDAFFPRYQGSPLVVPKGARHIRAVAFKNSKVAGREVRLRIADLAARIKQ